MVLVMYVRVHSKVLPRGVHTNGLLMTIYYVVGSLDAIARRVVLVPEAWIAMEMVRYRHAVALNVGIATNA